MALWCGPKKAGLRFQREAEALVIPEGCMEIGCSDTGSNGTYERRSALLEPPCNRHCPRKQLIRTDCVSVPVLFLCHENTSFVLLLTFKKKPHAVQRWLRIKSSDPNTPCIWNMRWPYCKYGRWSFVLMIWLRMVLVFFIHTAAVLPRVCYGARLWWCNRLSRSTSDALL